MNKTIKSLALGLLAVGVTSAAFAQGELNFFVTPNGTTKGVVNLPAPSSTPVGTTYYGQLYFSDNSAGDTGKTALSPVEAFNAAGQINYGLVTDSSGDGNSDAGNFLWYVLLVWSGGPNTSAAAALGTAFAGGGNMSTLQLAPGVTAYGESAVIKVISGGIDVNNVSYTIPQANGFNNFNVTSVAPVPEPSTIVLGGLGAAALMAFRRRK